MPKQVTFTAAEQTLCALLGSALFGAPSPENPKDLTGALRLAQAHAVQGVFGEALDALPENALPTEALLSLQEDTVILLRQNEALRAERRALCAFCREAGIPLVLLKGDTVARLYPTPELRVAGDIDCLLPPAYHAPVAAFLTTRGYTYLKKDGEDHHTAYKKGHVEVELHTAVHGIPSGEMGELVAVALAHVLPRAVTAAHQGDALPMPCPVHQGLILLLHLQQHLREGGVGLRQVLDWALFLQKDLPAVDAPALRTQLASLGLLRFAEVLTTAAVRHLGLPASASPFAACEASTADALLADILCSGNFGRASRTHAGSTPLTARAPGQRSAVASTLSYVAKKCKEEWQITQKCPPLLVFFVPYFILRRLICGRRIHLGMLRAAHKRNRLYDKLRLFEPTARKEKGELP